MPNHCCCRGDPSMTVCSDPCVTFYVTDDNPAANHVMVITFGTPPLAGTYLLTTEDFTAWGQIDSNQPGVVCAVTEATGTGTTRTIEAMTISGNGAVYEMGCNISGSVEAYWDGDATDPCDIPLPTIATYYTSRIARQGTLFGTFSCSGLIDDVSEACECANIASVGAAPEFGGLTIGSTVFAPNNTFPVLGTGRIILQNAVTPVRDCPGAFEIVHQAWLGGHLLGGSQIAGSATMGRMQVGGLAFINFTNDQMAGGGLAPVTFTGAGLATGGCTGTPTLTVTA